MPKVEKREYKNTEDSRQHKKNGVLEQWKDGVLILNHYSSTPMLHYSHPRKTFIPRNDLWQGIKSAMLKSQLSWDRALVLGKISGEMIEFC